MESIIFCPLPWMHLATRNDKVTRLCSQANSSSDKGINKDGRGVPLEIIDNNMEDIRNSEYMKKIRAQFLKGEVPESCSRCQKENNAGLRSRPDYENILWNDQVNLEKMSLLTSPSGEINIDEVPVLSMDIRLGNLCNLACRTCNPLESTLWYKDHFLVWGENLKDSFGKKISISQKKGKYYIKGIDYNWGKDSLLPISIRESLLTVKQIHFSGGEPLIIKEHHKILNYLIRINRSRDITLEYITNAVNISRSTLDLWYNFKEVKLGISIDGIGKVNDYIRHPSEWKHIEEMIYKIDSERITSWLAITVLAYNIFYLPEIIEWRLKSNFKNINSSKEDPIFSDHPLHSPKHLSCQIFPQEVKNVIEKKLITYLNSFNKQLYGENIFFHVNKLILGYIHYMKQDDLQEYYQKFLIYTARLDHVRDQSIKNYLPEFYLILEEYHGKNPFN